MIPSTEEFRLVFKSARTAGTPLVAIQTADPASAMTHVTASVNAKKGQMRIPTKEIGHSDLMPIMDRSTAKLGSLMLTD